MDLERPFRGSAAVSAGLVTRDVLRGPRFRRLLPDVYVPAGLEVDLALRSRAAAVWAGGHGVVVGYSAAELLGASCGSADALRTAVAPAAPRSESPMETRIRMAIHRFGLPPPVLQHPVGPYRLDLACPRIRLAVEYDGREHRTARRALRDLAREGYLARQNWDVLRPDTSTVLNQREVAIRVHRELFARGAVSGSPVGSSPLW